MKRIFHVAILGMVLSIMVNLNLQASNPPQNNLIHNVEEVNGVIVSEPVFKMDGGMLSNYMKHNYKYDDKQQRIEDEALKWNSIKESWDKDLCIRYTHTEKTITTEYYKWNKKKKDYILVPEMTVTMDK